MRCAVICLLFPFPFPDLSVRPLEYRWLEDGIYRDHGYGILEEIPVCVGLCIHLQYRMAFNSRWTFPINCYSSELTAFNRLNWQTDFVALDILKKDCCPVFSLDLYTK